jgi:cytochrome c oxidase cbb3-type subunit 3
VRLFHQSGALRTSALGPNGVWAMICLAGLVALGGACKREERGFRVSPPQAQVVDAISVSGLHPGGATTNAPVKNEYEQNAQALSEGKQLYERMNCVGCHAHGGGGMGPALIDDKWIYGSNPEQIFATIVQGRPNGMPSFAGKMPEQQVWKVAAYVRSLGGLTSKDPANGRSDHMTGKPPENTMPSQKPKEGGDLPKSAEGTQ